VQVLPEESPDLSIREHRLLAEFGAAGVANRTEEIAALRDPALELAGAFGMPTSRTLYALEQSLLAAKKYVEAVRPLEELIAMAPHDYNVALDLAIALSGTTTAKRSSEDLAKAERHARHAATLREPPANWKALDRLAKILAEQGRFDEGLAITERMPETGRQRWRRHFARGFIEFLRCLETYDSAAALAAIDHYERAGTDGGPAATMGLNIAAARALIATDGDPRATDDKRERFSQLLLAALRRDPTNSRHLRNLANNLPDEISPELGQELEQFFHFLSEVGDQDAGPDRPTHEKPETTR
jgi:tetratricopeptide (TPR) repeat protein